MSYTIRNTIILGAVVFVIVAVGVYLTMLSMPKRIKQLEADINKIEVDLQNTPDLANEYNVKTAELEDKKKRWETRNKDVPPKDISGETYSYLNRTIDVSGEVKLDMVLAGNRDYSRYGYNIYSLKGEATFDNLFKFISYIENGRRLYKISGLTLREYESKNKDTQETKILVLYEMELQAFYSSIPELNAAPGQRTFTPISLTANPFHPLILREIPPPQPGEIEIERSDLKAVIPGKAFIIDQNQKSQVLEEGSPVYLGYVTKILADQGKIECILNKGGVAERFELSIRVGQPIK